MRCVIFVVSGDTPFPFDMLRYDACYPMISEELIHLTGPRINEASYVTLAHNAPRKGWKPTRERWASFGWKVRGIMRDEAVR